MTDEKLTLAGVSSETATGVPVTLVVRAPKLGPKKPRMRSPTHWCVATLPDGTTVRTETSRVFTSALAANTAATPKQVAGWIVIQWALLEGELHEPKQVLDEQWHGVRKTALCPVVVEAVRKPEAELSEPEGVDPDDLTEAQQRCLAELQLGERSVWDFGSTTVHRLREMGLIETESGRARITDRGHVWPQKRL